MACRILFYGDSNTWGYMPGGERYPAHSRFPVIAAKALANGVAIEEGLNGRNCCFSHPLADPELLGGATFAEICQRALPLNALCLMLGTNDCMPPLYRSPSDIAHDQQRIIRQAKAFVPTILLLSPVPISQQWMQEFEEEMGALRAVRLQPLNTALEEVAKEEGVAFFDTQTLVPEADAGDGLHLSAQAHTILGTTIGALLATIIQPS
ncbi:MAG: hypothetical protein IJS54_06705 [Desulfovibrio sp.]|nr:hypothetical protein [Desulfovibrio sp.]